MKKLIYSLGILLLMFACSPIDNYKAPKETLCGKIIDKGTGETVQCEAGSAGIRIQLLEYSWDKNPTPLYFNAKMDGTFRNTRIFKGNYGVLPEGPFVPLKQFDDDGKVILDDSITTDIKGEVNLDFQVEPFLRIEWKGEPKVNDDGTLSVDVLITRGTDNPEFQQNVTDISLYLSPTKYLGNNDYVSKFSRLRKFSGDKGNEMLEQTITLTTKGAPYKNQKWFLRVGARIDYSVAGTQRYNYSTVKSIDL